MNILIATQYPIPHGGGLSAHVQDLMESLKKNGQSSSLIEGKMVEPSKFSRAMLLLKCLGKRNDFYRIALLDKTIANMTNIIFNSLKHDKYNLVHCHDPVAAYCAHRAIARLNVKVPVMETVHGPLTYESMMMLGDQIEKNVYLQKLWQLEQEAYTNSNHIIAVDTGQARIVIEDFKQDASKVAIVFNAVNVKAIQEIAQLELAVKYPQPFALVPRRLVHKTGVHIAIKALRISVMKGNNINLLIAGDGPLRMELEKLAVDCGVADKVIFIGLQPREQILRLAKHATAVIIPSIPTSGVIEATSIAALEAMACGTPVIASKIGGLAEVLRDGETGLLVEHSNEQALAQAIEKICDPTLKNRIGQEGHRFVLENMDTSKWILKVLDNYKSTLGQRKIRVAHLFEGPQTVGAVMIIKQLIDNIDRSQFELLLISALPGKFVNILRDEGYNVKILNLKTGEATKEFLTCPRKSLHRLASLYRIMRRESKTLRELLEAEHIDVLHTHHHFHHLLSAMGCKQDIASVWHLHAILNRGSLFGIQWKLFNHYAAKYASRVVAVSFAVKNSLTPKVKTKTDVVFNGIKISDFGDGQGGVVKKSWGFNEDDFVIGAVGRFTFIKGFHDFISMAEIVGKQFPNVKFVLIGSIDISDETKYLNECIEQIKKSDLGGRFKLAGKQTNPGVFMQGLNILIMPTVTWEGFGLAALEAQASGKPVVTTDCGGPRDIIIDGVTGFIVPRADVQAMSNRICRLLNTPELLQKMSRAGRERASMPQFDTMTMTHTIEHIYKTILLGRRKI